MRENGTLTWIITDHLGSTTALANEDGTLKTLLRYTAYGEIRAAYGSGEVTDYRYTGQRSEGEVGLYWYTSRMYDPALGRFIQPDMIVPNPYAGQSWDRYAYANNNPIVYSDPDGHIPIPLIVGIIIIVSKVIDYGWTAYDAWQSGLVLNDPSASQDAKDAAAVNLAMAVTFEAAEPDDLLPISLPLDDLARKGLIQVGKEVAEETGQQALKSFTKWNFRENLQRLTGVRAGDTLGKEAHHVLPQQFEKQFMEAGINIHDPIYGSWVDGGAHARWSSAYNNLWQEFLEKKPSQQEILDFARKLAKEYGFDVNFGSP